MTKMNSDRRDIYDIKPLPVGRISMLTVLILIILFAIGSLLITGYFSANRNNSAPIGNEDTRIKP